MKWRERREKREEREERGERRARRKERQRVKRRETSALRVPRAETRLTVYRSIYIQMQIVSILPCPAAICKIRGSKSKIEIYFVENVACTFRRDCKAY